MSNTLSFQELVELIESHAKIALDHPFGFKRPIKNVAIIGAGPNGLCSARFLKEEGMNVKIFERTDSIGGVWRYTDTVPPKPTIPTRLSQLEPKREKPSSACYRDLRVNIPSKHFGFPDFPFPNPSASDFPRHEEMLEYFKSYADHFNLIPLVEFNTSVDEVNKKGDEWELVLSESGQSGQSDTRERFDAVVAASGSHQEPFIPDIKGLADYDAAWPERIIHSKQFKRPNDFKDKDVLIIGVGVSGIDIARSLEGFARSVTMALKGSFISPIPVINAMREQIPQSTVIKPQVVSFGNTITFEDGTTLDEIDQIIFCTGYHHSLAYLKNLVVNDPDHVPESRVVLGREYALNTYHELFLISDPTFAFIAMPHMFSITPYYYTQAIAIARVWKGQACVPDSEWMARLTSKFNPGPMPSDLCACDRRRRQVYVSWLNHHASHLGLGLPTVTNFDDDYESEGLSRSDIWARATRAHFEKTRAKYSV